MPRYRSANPFFRVASEIEAEIWTPGATVPGVCTCDQVEGAHIHRERTGPTMPGEQMYVPVSDGDVVAMLPSGPHAFNPSAFASLFDQVP